MSDIRNADIALALLDPHGRNYRRHPESQVTRLQASLQKFGQPRSIVVQAQGERYRIVAGHGVTLAAQALGWASLRCDVLPEEWPEERVAAYLVADNELSRLAEDDDAALLSILDEARQYDDELLAAMGYDEAEFQALLAEVGPDDPAEDPGPQTDRAEELRQQWGVEPGQLWELGDHRLLCGDSTKKDDVERVMGGEKAGLIWTDPPYGVDHIGGTKDPRRKTHRSGGVVHNDDVTGLDLVSLVASAIKAIPVESTCAMYMASPGSENVREMIDAFNSCGFKFKHTLVWVKSAFVFGRADYHYQHELVLYGWRDSHEWSGSRNLSTVFEFPRGDKTIAHPTSKPVGLIAQTAANHPAKIIAEPFSGSGTTIIACEQLGRKCRAVEISPAYVAVALQRWADATGKTPELLP